MESTNEEFPSIAEQGKNLSKFVVEVVKSVVPKTTEDSEEDDSLKKLIFATSEQQKERMDICLKCPHFSSAQRRCKQCGCWLDHKVKFRISECPIHKWGKIE